MTKPIRWGILGTGAIAKKFATGLTALADATLAAVGSRTQAAADAFGDQFNVPARYDSYEALAQASDVDVIYVATPHTLHCENSLLCLAAGKGVLCEKPFTINAQQAKEVIDFARQKQLFLLEAMWPRYIPLIVKLRELLAQDVIGEVRMLQADLGFSSRFNPQSRLYDPALGGGAMLDVGVYPVSLASMIFGKPDRVVSMAHLGESGVDEQSAMVLGYAGGEIAIASTSIRVVTSREAVLLGSTGQIRLHVPWLAPTKMTISRPGQADEVIAMSFEGNGYNYEAAEVGHCLRAGKLESEAMPLDETLAIMETMDEARRQWGLKYPME